LAIIFIFPVEYLLEKFIKLTELYSIYYLMNIFMLKDEVIGLRDSIF